MFAMLTIELRMAVADRINSSAWHMQSSAAGLTVGAHCTLIELFKQVGSLNNYCQTAVTLQTK